MGAKRRADLSALTRPMAWWNVRAGDLVVSGRIHRPPRRQAEQGSWVVEERLERQLRGAEQCRVLAEGRGHNVDQQARSRQRIAVQLPRNGIGHERVQPAEARAEDD